MGAFDWLTTAREAVQNKLPDPGIQVPDFLTTGREKVQSGIGDVAGAVRSGATSGLPQDILSHIWGGLMTGNPTNTVMGRGPTLLGGNVGGGGTTQTTQTGANTPGPAATPQVASLGWNPLVANMFYNQAVAPLMSNLNNQFQDWNKQFISLAQNAPGQQYLSPSEKAMTQLMPQHMALENNLVAQAAENAVLTAPTIDSMQAQMGNIESALKQAYAEALKQNTATDASLYTGGSVAGTPGSKAATPTPTAGTPPTTSAAQEIQNALTQAQTANLPTTQQAPLGSQNVGAGASISGAGLSDAQKQYLQSIGFTVT